MLIKYTSIKNKSKKKNIRKQHTLTHTHLGLFELVLQITEVHVFVAQPLRSAQTDPINDGGMVQLVRQHCVIWAQQNLVQE